MVDKDKIYNQEWDKAFKKATSAETAASESLFSHGRLAKLRGKMNGMWDGGNRVGAVATGTKDGLKYLFLDKPLDIVKGTAKAGTKIPGFKLGGYAAAGAAGVGLLAFLANNGKKVVTEADVELPPVDTTAMANFDAPAPQMLTSEPPTLMGLTPVEGEHVSRLGKSGQQSFRDIAPPRAALDAGYEDVSTVPAR
jgi:hypothetical protein